jgi:hypothetical protein
MTTPVEELAKNVRRSRMSFHLNTARRRRWFMVQLVSMPVEQAAEETGAYEPTPAQAEARRRENWPQLVDQYRSSQLLRSLV